MAKLRRRVFVSPYASESMRGQRRCDSRHPMWHSVRCERPESDHVTHHADGRTFEWVQFLSYGVGHQHRA